MRWENYDSEVAVGRVSALFEEEKSEDGQAAQFGDVCDSC